MNAALLRCRPEKKIMVSQTNTLLYKTLCSQSWSEFQLCLSGSASGSWKNLECSYLSSNLQLWESSGT